MGRKGPLPCAAIALMAEHDSSASCLTHRPPGLAMLCVNNCGDAQVQGTCLVH